MATLYFRPGWQADQCIVVDLALVGGVCRAVLALVGVASILAAMAFSIVRATLQAVEEERKDAALNQELVAAAAACAAYEETPEARLRELETRGVESRNWAVDDELSTETCGVFFNRHEQAVIVAYRGTLTFKDWGSNLRRIVPGDEERSPSFQAAVETARRARDKYLLYRSILLTGHSRGGAMADFAGRKLGLPSTTFNPATWGKVLREQEPARQSVTTRTADVVSMLEVFFPGDRRVSSQRWWPKRWRHLLIFPALSLLFFAHAALLRANGCTGCVGLSRWLGKAAALTFVLGMLLFIGECHTVLNFTIDQEEKLRIAQASSERDTPAGPQSVEEPPPHAPPARQPEVEEPDATEAALAAM